VILPLLIKPLQGLQGRGAEFHSWWSS